MAKEPKDTTPPPLPPVSRKTMESGLITDSAVSENRRPESSVSESINFDFDIIGGAKLRKGITTVGNTLTGNILGLYYYIDAVDVGSPNSQLIVVNGTVASYLAANIWTSIRTGLTVGSKARFTTYLNFVFMVNGTEPTAIWDGTTMGSFVTTGNADGAPMGKYVESFKSRVWIAGDPDYPDRLYYSSLASADATPVIAWSTDPTTGTQFFDVNPLDGDSITALHRGRGVILVFKRDRIYRISSISVADPDPYVFVGTYSQESIVETKAGTYFHHSSGFYQYNIYGQVIEISRPIIDIIRAITIANYPTVSGWLDPDGDHLNWAIGTVTYGGVTYNNMVVRYSISTQIWTHRSYPTQMLNSSRYTDGSTYFNVVGDNDGNVFQYNNGTTDNGTDITYSIVHKWETIDGLLSTRKTIGVACFNHYGASGANVGCQLDTDKGEFKEVGQLQLLNTGFNTLQILKARRFRFKVSGSSKGDQFVYNGFELVGVTNEFLQFVPNK